MGPSGKCQCTGILRLYQHDRDRQNYFRRHFGHDQLHQDAGFAPEELGDHRRAQYRSRHEPAAQPPAVYRRILLEAQYQHALVGNGRAVAHRHRAPFGQCRRTEDMGLGDRRALARQDRQAFQLLGGGQSFGQPERTGQIRRKQRHSGRRRSSARRLSAQYDMGLPHGGTLSGNPGYGGGYPAARRRAHCGGRCALCQPGQRSLHYGWQFHARFAGRSGHARHDRSALYVRCRFGIRMERAALLRAVAGCGQTQLPARRSHAQSHAGIALSGDQHSPGLLDS